MYFLQHSYDDDEEIMRIEKTINQLRKKLEHLPIPEASFNAVVIPEDKWLEDLTRYSQLIESTFKQLLEQKEKWKTKQKVASYDLQEKSDLSLSNQPVSLAKNFHGLITVASQYLTRANQFIQKLQSPSSIYHTANEVKSNLERALAEIVANSLFISMEPSGIQKPNSQPEPSQILRTNFHFHTELLFPDVKNITVTTMREFFMTQEQYDKLKVNKGATLLENLTSTDNLGQALQMIDENSKDECIFTPSTRAGAENLLEYDTKKKKLELKGKRGRCRTSQSSDDAHRGRTKANFTKYVILFNCEIIIEPQKYRMQVFEPTLPFCVTTNNSENWKADAAILWENAKFQQYENESGYIDWEQLFFVLQKKFLHLTNDIYGLRQLLGYQKNYFAKLMKINEDGASFKSFAIANMKNREFPFYHWFYRIALKLTDKDIQNWWLQRSVLIHGFVEREFMQECLSKAEKGTFIIRFSESQWKYPICIHYVNEKNEVANVNPLETHEKMKTKSLREIISEHDVLTHICPEINDLFFTDHNLDLLTKPKYEVTCRLKNISIEDEKRLTPGEQKAKNELNNDGYKDQLMVAVCTNVSSPDASSNTFYEPGNSSVYSELYSDDSMLNSQPLNESESTCAEIPIEPTAIDPENLDGLENLLHYLDGNSIDTAETLKKQLKEANQKISELRNENSILKQKLAEKEQNCKCNKTS